MNYNMIAYLLGNILRIEGALMAVPVLVAFCYKEEFAATAFIAKGNQNRYSHQRTFDAKNIA